MIFPFLFAAEELYTVLGTKMTPFLLLMWGVVFTAGVVFFFLFSCKGTEDFRHQFNHLFDNISDGDIKGVVIQHNSEVYRIISAAANLFD